MVNLGSVRGSNRQVLAPIANRLARLALGCFAALLVLSLTACGSNRDSIAKGLPAPDRGFRIKEEASLDVYLWDCYQGKHIAIFRRNAEIYASDYERQEVACELKTPIEQSVALEGLSPVNLDPATFWGK